MNSSVTYSIAVPVYNSENLLDELCSRIIKTLSLYTFQIIFVDDASVDNSWQVLNKLKQQHPDIIKIVQLQKNYGQHAALLCAFSFCTGDYTITIDDDLQYAPEDILLLIQKEEASNADVIYGVTTDKKHSTIRNLGSNLVYFISWLYEDIKYKGSSFRLINKKVISAIADNHSNSYISLDNVLRWYTASFSFIDVPHYPRPSGTSGYNTIKLLKLYSGRATSYSILPLKLMTYIGFLFSVIFFLVGTYFICKKFFGYVPGGFTAIIVTILFCSSIITFCLGIIGQYLFVSHLAHQNKPTYSIKKIA